ncbi:MAG: methionine sulfoxide reductase [Sphingomonas bacterium]|uniref:peptide-methionine (R)-S-oxide reductase MsrB n=1 Tax=Sphingomonas bacterium TaxID=1895847 RepID=UPI002629032B|nr:peptide-methionine (R)-S-oxide reductase MsrB [Sphingomonas bacterium]MDB5696084.1 methionine sulfoxide reductase [Sphingomonas bacterium]
MQSVTFPTRRHLVGLTGLGIAGFAIGGCGGATAKTQERFAFQLTDAEWKKRLSPAAYRTLRHEDTERPGTSPLNGEKRAGVYSCAGCKLPLFSSRTKFESGTGWPSFWAPLANAVATKSDTSLFGERVEVHCRRCGGHLGHVFDDGPKPTGKRYCMNGVAMTFAAGRA